MAAGRAVAAAAPPYEAGAAPQTASWQTGASTPDRRPGVVTAGVIILWVIAALNIVLALVGLGGLEQQFGAAGVAAAMPAVVFGIVTALAIAVLAFFAWQRANWARIAVAAIVALSIIISIASGGGAGIVAILGVVLLFLPAANAWFTRRA